MPYIGKSPVRGGFHKLDNLTASATATYALTLGSAAYYPETANQLLVSLNGVIQAPQDSFTVSGSNLIFDSALTASDSIDFVVALGDVLGVQGVTDGTVTTNKIANGAVTDAKLAAGVGGVDGITSSSTSGTALSIDANNVATFNNLPSGVIGISTPTILTNNLNVSVASQTQLGSHAIYYAAGNGVLTNTYTKKSSTSIITAHWAVNYAASGPYNGSHSFFCAADTSGNAGTYIAMMHDFARLATNDPSGTNVFCGSGPFVGLSSGTYNFIMGPARGASSSNSWNWNVRQNSDQIPDQNLSSYLYVTETEV